MAIPYADRVAKGAALLDQARPGWWQEIATDRLAMEKCDDCILGQLYGNFWAGSRKVLLPRDGRMVFSPAKHGFALREREQVVGSFEEQAMIPRRWAALADAWRAEIRRRRTERPAPDGVGIA